jgi:hypothetical protein
MFGKNFIKVLKVIKLIKSIGKITESKITIQKKQSYQEFKRNN